MRYQLTRFVVLVTAILLSAGVGAAQKIASPQAELRMAMDKAAVDGDLAGAITRYKAIVQKYQKTDRTIAATALLQMADCYQKLGDAQARAAYERVTREFADVSAVAAAAKGQLQALDSATRGVSTPTLSLRRLYDGPGVEWCSGLSSDARYLSYTDWSTGNIAVADLRNSTVRPVTATATVNQTAGEFGECSVFSPDDKQIAYYWKSNTGPELRIIGMDGSKVRSVFRNDRYIRPLDWSADGRSILLEAGIENGRHLVTVATDGTSRVVKSLGPGRGVGARFSPDGQYIAYSALPSADATKADLFVMRADGTGDVELVRHPANESVLGWAPDSRRVFFLSDRTGSNGVWSITLDNGKAVGAPILNKADIGAITDVRLLGGTLYYSTRSDLSDIYLAKVSPDTGLMESAPAPAKTFYSTSNYAPDWSPDGNLLAYRSIPGAGDPVSGPPALISILNVNTREERQVRPELDALDFNDGPHWSPDGRSLLVIGMQNSSQAGVYKVDASTGATTPLVKAGREQWLLRALWSHDGASVFYVTGNPVRIVRRDLSTGADHDVVNVTGPGGAIGIALSPDGRLLAFTRREPGIKTVMSVNVVSSEGGPTKAVYRSGEGEGIGSLVWTPDGKYMFFLKRVGAGATPSRPESIEYWRVNAGSGAAEKLALGIPRSWVRFSPDGHRIALAYGDVKTELWALENLVAPAVRR